MQYFLNQYSLKTRILFLPALPMLVLLALMIYEANSARQLAGNAKKLATLLEFAPYVSNLVHELQKERGRSAGYIGSGGAAERKRMMNTQRDETDGALSRFNVADEDFDAGAYGDNFSQHLNTAKRAVAELGRARGSTDNLSYSIADMAGYYSSTIAALLEIVHDIAVISDDAMINKEITAYIGLLEAKERAGQERAIGNGGYVSGQFSDGAFKTYIELIAKQDAYMDTFDIFAPETLKRKYASTVRGREVDLVQDMRDYAIAQKGAVADGPYQGTVWFDNITAKINLLKEVEDFANQEIQDSTAKLLSGANTIFLVSIVLIVFFLVLLSVLFFLVFSSIDKPFKALFGEMDELVTGNFDVAISCTDYGSEIGRMANALDGFRKGGLERRRLRDEAEKQEKARLQAEKEQAEAEAQAAARKQEEEQKEAARIARRAEQMQQVTDEFEQEIQSAVSVLMGSSKDLTETADSMSRISEEAQRKSASVASASEEASVNVQTVASASEEMSVSIQEINRQVSESETISKNAATDAGNAVKTVEELSDTSKKIGNIVSLISDIAEQTNLLALNATIEAARAGDAGKGFAVVASEVKSLANQTAKATDEIGQQVSNMQRVSQDVSEVVVSVQKGINNTSNVTVTVAAAMEEQGVAISEISRAVQEASKGTQQVSSSITDVAQNITETSSASGLVGSSAEKLSEAGDKLDAIVQKFLRDVQAIN